MERDLAAAYALAERGQYRDALEIIGTGDLHTWNEKRLRPDAWLV